MERAQFLKHHIISSRIWHKKHPQSFEKLYAWESKHLFGLKIFRDKGVAFNSDASLFAGSQKKKVILNRDTDKIRTVYLLIIISKTSIKINTKAIKYKIFAKKRKIKYNR